MTDTASTGAVVLVGCGRLGSAILEGWLATGAVAPTELVILTPSAKPAAVAGSAPAFIHAFVQALARAGESEGLPREAAERLARGALRSAGAGAETGASLDDLIGRVASPGGTTRAGLEAIEAAGDLERAAEAAVGAAVRRAREISG